MENNTWKTFWHNYRNIEAKTEEDLYYQVGKTINKKPILIEVFNKMIEDIKENLKLDKNDELLEFCCGNGMVSKPLSNFVSKVYAGDFTSHLIETAKLKNSNTNIDYQIADAKMNPVSVFNFSTFPEKILMNESLAYFTPDELEEILKNITAKKFKFLITQVPIDDLKWNFYSTDEAKSKYLSLKEKNDVFFDGLGRWWKIEELEAIAKKFELDFEIRNQDSPISNYRINVLFEKK